MRFKLQLFSFIILISSYLLSSAAGRILLNPTNETDWLSLLSIKSNIVRDPFRILASWNNSIHFCNWKGVFCSPSQQRVMALSLSKMGLGGTLSPYIGNFTFLNNLDLDNNFFHGKIPQEIGKLYRLLHISLYDNSFQGEIPKDLAQCSNLRHINLDSNRLEGKIPSELSSLSSLQKVVLSQNNLSGTIPSSFGNLSALVALDFSFNNLEGSIPTQFSKLSNLEDLRLSSNRLSGALPAGLNLPGLEVFYVGENQFMGPLPASITNASSLEVLDIHMNNISGPIPMNIGNLKQLRRLFFSGNPLGSEKTGLNFLTSLTNCTKLRMLHLDNNNHRGILPASVAALSSELISLRLDGNHISGSVPESIGNLTKLQGLYLSRNNLTGVIPSSIGYISFLSILEMQENDLRGVIPVSLSNCTRLEKLDLSKNRLTGDIPVQIVGLSSLSVGLNLAQNQLSGPLPLGVNNLINLISLDVSNNNLSGELPYALGSCLALEILRLQGNHFDSSIPEIFHGLKGLEFLDLSSNNLSGAIPVSLAKIPALQYLNLSFNLLEGEVPNEGFFSNMTASSIIGNRRLCGGILSLNLSKCKKEKKEKPSREGVLSDWIVYFLLIAGYFTFAVLVYLPLFYSRTRETTSQAVDEEASDPPVGDHYRKLSYKELREATDGFSADNLIAMGRCSSVYKGILKNSEQRIAVKVLNLQIPGSRKSFEAECEALRNIRHRNLVKIITSCSGTDFNGSEFKGLVFEFMPNGSLESWLHPSSTSLQKQQKQQKSLNLIQRLNIAIDVASAIYYLHHCCEIRIIHRDIKPSNVLLNHKLSAHLADFGSARSLLLPIEKSTHLRIRSSAIGIIGTVGYIALECGMGGPVSTLVDVYSYGILLLEMFTGKRPTASMFIDDFSLHNYVKMGIPNQVLTIADPTILSGGTESIEKTKECLVSIFHIGLQCSAPLPRDRMDIADALMELKVIRDIFLRVDEALISIQE